MKLCWFVEKDKEFFLFTSKICRDQECPSWYRQSSLRSVFTWEPYQIWGLYSVRRMQKGWWLVLSTWYKPTKLVSFGKRGSQPGKWAHKMGLPASLQCSSLINDWRGCASPIPSTAIPGQVVMSCIRKQTEQAREQHLLHGFCFGLEFLPSLPSVVVCDL